MEFTNSGASSFGGGPFGFGGGMSGFETGSSGFGAGPSGFSSGPFGIDPSRQHMQQQQQQQDPAVQYPLNLSLEELFWGCSKKMKISRRVVNPDGTTSRQDKVVTIDVKPGWKAGTKITFAQEGDQAVGRTPADIIFVVNEKPHTHFTRDGNDLKHTISISLRDALCGCEVNVPTINGGHHTLCLTEPVNPHTMKRVVGHGMPLSKHAGKMGDLVVRFDIQFPRILNEKQKQELSRIMPVY